MQGPKKIHKKNKQALGLVRRRATNCTILQDSALWTTCRCRHPSCDCACRLFFFCHSRLQICNPLLKAGAALAWHPLTSPSTNPREEASVRERGDGIRIVRRRQRVVLQGLTDSSLVRWAGGLQCMSRFGRPGQAYGCWAVCFSRCWRWRVKAAWRPSSLSFLLSFLSLFLSSIPVKA